MKKIIAISALLAVLMSGCGKIDDPTAARTEGETDTRTEISTTEETTSAEKQTTAEGNNTAIKVTEPTFENVTATENNIEASASDYETDKPDIQQETTVQKTAASENEIIPTTNVEILPNEIAAEEPTQAYIDEVSEIFNKLNSLSYKPDVCDGIPEKSFVAEDGTFFQVNFSERWVWRNFKEEAYLTDELYNALIGSEPICLQ